MSEDERYHKLSKRLHHLSIIFASNVLAGRVASEYVRLSVRDVADLAYFLRAEVNAITKLLIDKGIVEKSELIERINEELEILINAKEEQFKIALTDQGISFDLDKRKETT